MKTKVRVRVSARSRALICCIFTDADVWDEDSAYVEMLANEGQRLREKSERAAAGEEVDDEDVEEDIEEELGYISPLDTVDPYVTFKHALTGVYRPVFLSLSSLMPLQCSR